MERSLKLLQTDQSADVTRMSSCEQFSALRNCPFFFLTVLVENHEYDRLPKNSASTDMAERQ